jgi:hypothetical protein
LDRDNDFDSANDRERDKGDIGDDGTEAEGEIAEDGINRGAGAFAASFLVAVGLLRRILRPSNETDEGISIVSMMRDRARES